jgi:hemolysin D
MSFAANFRHHWDVFLAALAEEKSKAAANAARLIPKSHERQFLPAALEITETPASPLGRALALAIAAFFAVAVGWSVLGEIDIIATAQGKIIPSGHVKVIQPHATGVIRAIHVSDGQMVKAGQVLIEIDPTGADADRKRLGRELMMHRIEMARLEALLAANPEPSFAPPADAPRDLVTLHREYLTSDWQAFRAKLTALDGTITKHRAELQTVATDIRRLETIVPKVRQRVEGRRELVAKQYVPALEFAKLEEELLDKEGQLAVQRQKREETKAALEAATAERKKAEGEFRRETFAKLAESRQRTSAAEQELIKAEEVFRLRTLTAPVDGKVQQLAIHTVGGVVTEAQKLMVIVPEDSRVLVEAMVLNKDIGFVHAGQEAELKIESFPFTKYGTIQGRVLNVSADAVHDEQAGLVYPAHVAMARATMRVEDKTVNLGPGMAVTVEIKTGTRRVIEYLLAPLQKYKSESLKER